MGGTSPPTGSTAVDFVVHAVAAGIAVAAEPRAVLAVWPNEATLQLASELAAGGPLCIIPGRAHDVRPWLAHALGPLEVETALADLIELDEHTRNRLDYLLDVDGRNGFFGYGRDQAIKVLRRLVGDGHQLDPEAVLVYAVESGKTTDGAKRLADICDRVLDGRRFRDSSGHLI